MVETNQLLKTIQETKSDGLNTLMYPSIDRGSFVITNKDIENFCKLYGCNVSKLNNQ